MSRKLTLKQLNQLKYDGASEEINEEVNNDIIREKEKLAKIKTATSLKNRYFGTLMEGKKNTSDKDTVAPKDEERLQYIAKEKLQVAEELMRRWTKVEKKENK